MGGLVVPARAAKVPRGAGGKSCTPPRVKIHILTEKGIEALESDLGEYIIQVDHELPSHIIMPAIHKNREEFSKVFSIFSNL